MKRYDKYKPSGIDWIGEVPEHWDITKVKYVVKSIGSGGTPTSGNEAFYSDEGTPWVAIGDMSDADFVYDTQKHLTKEGIADKSLTIYPKGTLLYSIYATLGKVAVLAIPATINQAILAIVLKDSYNQDFFKYNLKAMERYVFSQSNGNTQFNLSAQKVSNFEVLNCSLAEQEAIAAYLDARCGDIDKVVATQEKRIALLNEMKRSIITQAVTQGLNPDAKMKDSGVEWIGLVPEHWEVRKIKYCCKDEKYSIKTGPFGTQLKGEDLKDDGPVCVYNQRNVIDDDFTITSFFVSEEKASQLNSFFTKPSDVLITSRGTIGRCSILPEDALMGILHPCLIAMRINQTVCNLNWLKMYINETNCFTTAVKINSNATTIDVIYTDTLKNIDIPMPSLDEQEEIISYLDVRCGTIDKQIKAVTRQIELLREYKQSLITEVVTGKRKVC